MPYRDDDYLIAYFTAFAITFVTVVIISLVVGLIIRSCNQRRTPPTDEAVWYNYAQPNYQPYGTGYQQYGGAGGATAGMMVPPSYNPYDPYGAGTMAGVQQQNPPGGGMQARMPQCGQYASVGGQTGGVVVGGPVGDATGTTAAAGAAGAQRVQY